MEDPSFDTLTSERLTVRRFRAADAGTLAAYRRDPDVARYQAWDTCSHEEAQRFIESLRDLAPGTPGAGFQFAVALASSGSLIGDCFLRCPRSEPRQGELGFTFAKAHQGQGYATEAVGCVLRYTFRELDLHRVFSVTDERNVRASRLLARLRFRREGCFRQNTWSKGEWTSEFLYAQLQEEWRRHDPA